MALFDQHDGQEFIMNFPAMQVFGAMCRGLQSLSGFKVTSANPQALAITVSVSISLFTWGEDMFITLIPYSANQTAVQVVSKLKLGTEIAGHSKNKKNIEKVMNAMQAQLYPQ